MALTLKYQTGAEFAARFWARVAAAYAAGDKLTYHKLIWWVWQRVQDGDLTNDQVRLSFNAYFGRTLNTPQWNSFVTSRLVPIKDRYLAMLAEGAL